MCYNETSNFPRGSDISQRVFNFFHLSRFFFVAMGIVLSTMNTGTGVTSESETLKISPDDLLKIWRKNRDVDIEKSQIYTRNLNYGRKLIEHTLPTPKNISKYSNNGQVETEDPLLEHTADIWSATDNIVSQAIGRRSNKHRSKRSVLHLFNMVVCATGCNPLIYKGYGCYCGFLGSGYPVDGIDRCCWMHDRCYDATGCPTFSEYFVPYYWKCYRGYRPICAVTHGKLGGSGSCSQRLCECDRALSQCLRRFPCPQSKAVCTSSPFRLVQNIFMIF